MSDSDAGNQLGSHTNQGPFRTIARYPGRYPLTLGFGIVIIVAVILGAELLISKVSQGANQQLTRSLENEISDDLTREFGHFSFPGPVSSIDGMISGNGMEAWFERISSDIGISIAVLVDPSGKPVWTSDLSLLMIEEFDEDHNQHLAAALSGVVVSELHQDVQLVDAQGRYYTSNAIETYIPVISGSGDEVIGALEVYVDIEDELDAAISAARSNIIDRVVEVMVVLVVLLIGSVFVAEVLLHRAERRRRHEEQQRRSSIENANAILEEQISARTAELTRSNKDLEQFAYVASHDLQEPLRMVSSYTQLLARRYRGQLGKDGDEFIEFAVDGARRMQGLINDLLQYSRVGSQGGKFTRIDSAAPLDDALGVLSTAIDEAGAAVEKVNLPEIVADEAQMSRLFQNLVGNAIKYRSEAAPRIRVSAERLHDCWQFEVRDNGIGVNPAFTERIFTIFQRLHSREEYQGSGIGLAISKRIVERRGGTIWMKSKPGIGSSFFFTVPDRLPNMQNTPDTVNTPRVEDRDE